MIRAKFLSILLFFSLTSSHVKSADIINTGRSIINKITYDKLREDCFSYLLFPYIVNIHPGLRQTVYQNKKMVLLSFILDKISSKIKASSEPLSILVKALSNLSYISFKSNILPLKSILYGFKFAEIYSAYSNLNDYFNKNNNKIHFIMRLTGYIGLIILVKEYALWLLSIDNAEKHLKSLAKKIRILESSTTSAESTNEDICSICRENNGNLMKTSCGHYVHRDCLSTWFYIKTECPTCRTNLVPNANNQVTN